MFTFCHEYFTFLPVVGNCYYLILLFTHHTDPYWCMLLVSTRLTYPETGSPFNTHLFATEAAFRLGPVWSQADGRHVDGVRTRPVTGCIQHVTGGMTVSPHRPAELGYTQRTQHVTGGMTVSPHSPTELGYTQRTQHVTSGMTVSSHRPAELGYTQFISAAIYTTPPSWSVSQLLDVYSS